MQVRFWALVPLILFSYSANFAGADEVNSSQLLLDPLVKKAKVFGKELSAETRVSSLPSGLGVLSETQSKFLGRTTPLVAMSVQATPESLPVAATPESSPAAPSPTPSGIELAQTNLYVHGIRVWTGDLRFDKGSLVYQGGIAPTQIPFPLFVYPLGPLLLRVDAGIEFEGLLDASLTPGVSIPISDSTLQAKLEAKIGAAAFIQGYGSLYLVRGGVGGRVQVVEGSTGVEANLYFNGAKPTAAYLGKIVFLKGALYGFVDTNLLFGRWTRVLSKDFFSWPGKCFAFGAESCAIQ